MSQDTTNNNHSSVAAFLWSVADLLRGDFRQSQYGRIILPFTLLRRLECVLEATKPEVLTKYDAVKAMIENGTNINRKSTGLTPLMFAARYNKVEIVKLLINKGAKLKTKSERGNFTALQYAKMSKAHEAYKLIKTAMDK